MEINDDGEMPKKMKNDQKKVLQMYVYAKIPLKGRYRIVTLLEKSEYNTKNLELWKKSLPPTRINKMSDSPHFKRPRKRFYILIEGQEKSGFCQKWGKVEKLFGAEKLPLGFLASQVIWDLIK